jgi:hypothetical protein
VSIPQKKGPDSPWWPVHDCPKNAWAAVKIAGIGDSNRGQAGPPRWDGCSDGLMYDPLRKLILAVDAGSVVYALRLDPGCAEVRELE